LGNRSPLPGSASCSVPWNREVRTPDVILGSPSRRLKEVVETQTRPSDWWSEMEICASRPDQVGCPGVVSVWSQCRLILHRGPSEPRRTIQGDASSSSVTDVIPVN
jgi:hypothetical protein